MKNLFKKVMMLSLMAMFSASLAFAQNGNDKEKETHRDKVDKCVKEKRDKDLREHPVGRRIHDKTAGQLDRLKCEKEVRSKSKKQ